MRIAVVLLLSMALTGCSGAAGEEDQAATGKDRIECALEGAAQFERTCTVGEMQGADGAVLIVGRSDTGYRRLQIATDGHGVVSADGAEAAKVTIVGEGLIEVAVGRDRYRLPADTGGAK